MSYYYDIPWDQIEGIIGSLAWVFVVIFVIGIGLQVGLAFIPASIAKNKGYSYGGFWAFGFFLFLPALIVSLCIDDKTKQYFRYDPQTGQQYGQPNNQQYQQQTQNKYNPYESPSQNAQSGSGEEQK